jgi:hypothetical protein
MGLLGFSEDGRLFACSWPTEKPHDRVARGAPLFSVFS